LLVPLDNVEQFTRPALHHDLVALGKLMMWKKFVHQRHRVARHL